MADDQPIVIKKVKKGGGHGHHGGAWKVAYADFVTAMMAFFLLMWLINTTTPEQKRGIADFFAPASVSPNTSGSGGLLGGTDFGEDGVRGRGSSSMVEQRITQPVEEAETEEPESGQGEQAGGAADLEEVSIVSAMERRDAAALYSAEQSIRQALQDLPELAELSKSVILDQTPEGLRIQLVDQEGRPMFARGTAEPLDRAIILLRAVARIIEPMRNRITVAGHTDAGMTLGPSFSPWDLSSQRAGAALAVLLETGVSNDRVYQVTGKGASDPLFPDDPYQAGNRRVSITLMREAPVAPPDFDF